MVTEQKIRSILKNASIDLERIDSIFIRDQQVGVVIHPDAANDEQAIHDTIAGLDGVEKITIVQTDHIQPTNAKQAAPASRSTRPIAGVKHVIAVGSGKGGVGKSTIALNLAIALSQLGKQVGIVDADIYGPSIAHMVGLKDEPEIRKQTMIPHQAFGISCLSMGMLLDDDKPTIWRGPMVTKALRQLLLGAAWDHQGPLDVLIIDLPPGTGDVQLSLAQQIQLDAVLLVATAQEMALLDVKKAAAMFDKLQVPVVGVIENMSHFTDPSGTEHLLFGEKKLTELVDGLPVLASLPMLPDMAKASDQACPFVHAQQDHAISQSLRDAAQRILDTL